MNMPPTIYPTIAGPPASGHFQVKQRAARLDVTSFFQGPSTVLNPHRPPRYTTQEEYKEYLAQAPDCPAVRMQRLQEGHITKDEFIALLRADREHRATQQEQSQTLSAQKQREEKILGELRVICGWTEEEYEVKRVCSQVRLEMKHLQENRPEA